MARLPFTSFIRSQWTRLPPVKTVDLTGRTVVVTGANVGLGLEAAKHFARMKPAHLVLACRNKEKGEAAIAVIQRETGFIAELLLVDLDEFASISSFVTAFEEKYDRLDTLVLNAGIVNPTFSATKDGYEQVLQVNYLSSAMLALLLLPIMDKTSKEHNTFPHISVVSSEAHFRGDIPTGALKSDAILKKMSDPKYCGFSVMRNRYNETKLLNVQFTRALNSRLKPGSSVIVNSVNPGFCYSSIRRNIPLVVMLVVKPMELTLARQTEEGARTLVWGALAGEGEDDDPSLRDTLRGAYTSDCKVSEPSDFLFSQEGKECEPKIWKETLEILAKADPRIQEIAAEFLNE